VLGIYTFLTLWGCTVPISVFATLRSRISEGFSNAHQNLFASFAEVPNLIFFDICWRRKLHSPQAARIDRTIGGADNLWMADNTTRATPFPRSPFPANFQIVEGREPNASMRPQAFGASLRKRHRNIDVFARSYSVNLFRDSTSILRAQSRPYSLVDQRALCCSEARQPR
jgi:hypothetical protein